MLPAGLSMFWERADAHVALRERFGFGGFGAASAWCLRALDTRWGIRATGCSRLVISDRNALLWTTGPAEGLVVKWSADRSRFARLDATTRLLRELADRGLPVAGPVAALDGSVRPVLDGPGGPLSVAVLPQLPGDWLRTDDPAAVASTGRCLARVHAALREVAVDAALATPPPGGLRERIRTWLDTEDRGRAPDASRALGALLDDAPPLDPAPQPVHGDVRAANVLVTGSRVSGLLDLDEAHLADPLADLAQASVYLATRFTDWRPTPRAARAALLAGYESVSPLDAAERARLEILVRWTGLRAIPAGGDPHGWARAV